MAGAPGDSWQVLVGEGWAITEQGKNFIAAESPGKDVASLRQTLLNYDLRKIGEPTLPQDVNRAVQASLQGPLVLQVVSMDDIGKPSRTAAESSSATGRLLRAKLTDGKLTAACIEYQPISQCSAATAPGTKVVLKGKCQIRSGIILLESKNIDVLGGRVEALAEPWEVQRKYGGLDRVRATGPDADAVAPPFRQFIPGHKSKTRPGADHSIAYATPTAASSEEGG
eukprot:CAMPEP_0117683282 /NCGR_PEP_ID=MMETSP0804-20121206/20278_1 /TAXON_ID=1074897 /ORGANISM="Tetraselmis astigmatica, Strain CCMP880" /LENGTH=225 /DNA_ID=CAMNT_0005493787 /DNA_START=186 /DNA_END=859 /DNA_ORIENTATION=-